MPGKEGEVVTTHSSRDRIEKALECRIKEFGLLLQARFPKTTYISRTTWGDYKKMPIPAPNARCMKSKHTESDGICTDQPKLTSLAVSNELPRKFP